MCESSRPEGHPVGAGEAGDVPTGSVDVREGGGAVAGRRRAQKAGAHLLVLRYQGFSRCSLLIPKMDKYGLEELSNSIPHQLVHFQSYSFYILSHFPLFAFNFLSAPCII